MHIASGKERKVGTATYTHLTWRKKTSRQGSVGQSELAAAALLKAVWCDLRLARLLTHLFLSCLGS